MSTRGDIDYLCPYTTHMTIIKRKKKYIREEKDENKIIKNKKGEKNRRMVHAQS